LYCLQDANTTICNTLDDYHGQLVAIKWPWVDATVYSFIPFVTIVIFNSLIIRSLLTARHQRDQLSSTAATATTSSGATLRSSSSSSRRSAGKANDRRDGERRPFHDRGGGSNCNSARQSRAGERRSMRLIAMLLTVSFTFLAATLPRCTVMIFISYPQNPSTPDEWRTWFSVQLVYVASEMLMYANHAVNFFLYCIAGQRFRSELNAMLRRRSLSASSYESATKHYYTEQAARRSTQTSTSFLAMHTVQITIPKAIVEEETTDDSG